MRKMSPSKTAYFHDQKGEFHEPAKTVVPEFSDEWAKKIRGDYLEGRRNVAEELKRLQSIISFIREDQTALEMLASLLNDCVDYRNLVEGHIVAERLSGTINVAAYQMSVHNADLQRKLKHEALMADLKAFRLYMMKHYGPEGNKVPHDANELPPTVIYTGKATHRTAIGMWAMRMADTISELEQRELDLLKKAIGEPEAIAAE